METVHTRDCCYVTTIVAIQNRKRDISLLLDFFGMFWSEYTVNADTSATSIIQTIRGFHLLL